MPIELIIPAYEPDDRMPEYVESLVAAGFSGITVVDDGSGPEYGPIFAAVQKLGCRVLVHGENRGKGAALKTAFSDILARGGKTPDVVTVDCDGQHTVEDVQAVCAAMAEHPGTLVLGSRTFGAETPTRSALGNRVTSAAVRILYGIDLGDTQTGLRGIPGAFLAPLGKVAGSRYEYELEMLLWARRSSIEFQLVPIRTVYFDNNAGSHYRTVADSLRLLGRLLNGVVQYGAAAGLSAITDVFVYCLLVKLCFQSMPLAGRVLAAAAVARTVSSVVNYICNRRLPMVQNHAVRGTLWKYYCLWAFQLAASVGGTMLLCGWTGMDEMPAKLLVDLLLAVASYQVQLHWVFAAPKEEPDPLPHWDGFGHLAKNVVRFFLPKWHVEGTVPTGPVVYVVHHQNMYGPIHTVAALPDVHIWALHVFTDPATCFDQYYNYTFTKRFGWPRPLAFCVSGVLSLFIPLLMRGIGAVPVHRKSLAVRETMRQSEALLARGESLVICPDVDYSADSAAMGETYTGFLALGDAYERKTGQALRFVPVHCSANNKALCLGAPVTCQGRSQRRQAAAALAEEINAMAAQRGDLAALPA